MTAYTQEGAITSSLSQMLRFHTALKQYRQTTMYGTMSNLQTGSRPIKTSALNSYACHCSRFIRSCITAASCSLVLTPMRLILSQSAGCSHVCGVVLVVPLCIIPHSQAPRPKPCACIHACAHQPRACTMPLHTRRILLHTPCPAMRHTNTHTYTLSLFSTCLWPVCSTALQALPAIRTSRR